MIIECITVVTLQWYVSFHEKKLSAVDGTWEDIMHMKMLA